MEIISEMFQLRNVIDIVLVAATIYLLLLLFRGTIAAQALKGLAIVGVFILIANFFYLQTLSWIIERLAPVILIGIIVLFQPEIRRGLARIGERSFSAFFTLEGERVVDEVAKAAAELARHRYGALIAFERDTGLESFVETGIVINAEITEELITTIFFPKTALHDGAMIVRGNTIVAAACILPLAHEETLRTKYGTRHRAALGLSKETDAVVVVISEERGEISLAVAGELRKAPDAATLTQMLTVYLAGGKKQP